MECSRLELILPANFGFGYESSHRPQDEPDKFRNGDSELHIVCFCFFFFFKLIRHVLYSRLLVLGEIFTKLESNICIFVSLYCEN